MLIQYVYLDSRQLRKRQTALRGSTAVRIVRMYVYALYTRRSLSVSALVYRSRGKRIIYAIYERYNKNTTPSYGVDNDKSNH